MSVKINWSCNIQVINGPKLSGSDTIEVDAYDNIEVTVPKKGNDVGKATVEVQPGAQTKVMFLLIQAGTYQGAPLTYKVDGSNKPAVKLDAQQLMIGSGAVSLLDGSPTKLNFENSGAADIPVRILIGRKAT